MEDRAAGLQQAAHHARLLVMVEYRELHRFALIRLGGARKQAQPESAGIAVTHGFEREAAKHLATELRVAERLLVRRVRDQRQDLTRFVAMIEGFCRKQIS